MGSPEPQHHSLERLADDGDRRSIGQSNALAVQVLATPSVTDELFAALKSDDSVLRLRVADALEKVSAARADLFESRTEFLVHMAEQEQQHEVRWHLAQMLPRLTLTEAQKERVVAVLFDYIDDSRSIIVRTSAMDALFRLAQGDPALMARVRPILLERSTQGRPAERARARKLLGTNQSSGGSPGGVR